jgi:penicillin-binding protein 1A
MRSVHGISVAGGTFPAQIWHNFMSVAKGDFCGDFPPPKSTITWSPFFSKSSGYKGSYTDNQGGYGNSYGGGYSGYDPRIYGQQPPTGNGGGDSTGAGGTGPQSGGAR